MVNTPSVRRVTKSSRLPIISGLNGQPMHNRILLGLPCNECDAIFPDLEYVQMQTHHVLHEAGQPITHGAAILLQRRVLLVPPEATRPS